MADKEFRPLPDEFNLGYKPPAKEEEKEKKKKRRRLRRILTLAAALLIILPLTLHSGLFQSTASLSQSGTGKEGSYSAGGNDQSAASIQEDYPFREMEGTYVSSGTFVHLESGQGWFYNGTYFIPLTYDTKQLTYQAAGAYPEDTGMALDSTAFYISCQGVIETDGSNLILYDPFNQETAAFHPTGRLFQTAYINRALESGSDAGFLSGRWTGSYTPASGYPMAYLKSIVLSSDGGLQVIAGDSESENTSVYSGSWTLEDGILKTAFDLPLEYEIETEERTIQCSFEQNPEGIVFYTESGCFIFLNIFSSQLFVH